MDVEGLAPVSFFGIGLPLFVIGTFLVTLAFDVLCRENWRRRYRLYEKNRHSDDLLSNRYVQIFIVIVIQVVIQFVVIGVTPISLTGDTMWNDTIMAWHSWNAAQFAFSVVNIPWLLWLNYQEYRERRVAK
jgi:hypothetical protein